MDSLVEFDCSGGTDWNRRCWCVWVRLVCYSVFHLVCHLFCFSSLVFRHYVYSVCDLPSLAFQAKRWRVVTLDGKLIETAGTLSGGGQQQLRGAMKLSSKAQMAAAAADQEGTVRKKGMANEIRICGV